MSQLAVTDEPTGRARTSPAYPAKRSVGSILDLVRLAETDQCVPGPAPGRDQEALRILHAARSVLERSRFRSLKVRQVLVASNTSASNFYRYFPSKSHLLLALLEDEIARSDLKMAEQLARESDAESRLRAWLVYNIRIIYQPRRAERARLFLDPALLEDLPDEVNRLYEVAGQRLAKVIRGGIDDLVFRPGDPVADAAMVQNLMRGLITNGLAGHLDMSEEEALRTVSEFVLYALRSAPARALS